MRLRWPPIRRRTLRTYPKNKEITFLYSKNRRFFEYKKVDPSDFSDSY
jgi:hypothetical protein